MNKYQKALDELRSECKSQFKTISGTTMYSSNKKDDERCDLLQELVNKETPMKIIEYKYEGRCPKCNEINGEIGYTGQYNYCWNCGQKLDWSDEDE